MKIRFNLIKGLAIASIIGGTLCAASAQDKENMISTIMTAQEAKSELFGVWLEGETAQTHEQWSECIEPDGKTRYIFGGVELEGQLSIQDDGQACFSYRTDGYDRQSCFRISRAGEGYTFWGGVEGVFTTTSVLRNIKSCPSSNIPTS